MPTTATRSVRSAPIGHGAAHQALEDAKERAKLQSICAAIGCAPGDVSGDGVHIELPRVLNALRRRGYAVGEPYHGPVQGHRRYTVWYVDVTLPHNGPGFTLGYFKPNTS